LQKPLEADMKIKTLVLATSVLAAASGTAFAQSAPSPSNQSGPGVSPTSPAPTDPGASETGNTRGVPSRGTLNDRPGDPATTGTSQPTPGSTMQENSRRGASPASPAEGNEKIK
jgi:hypothetical protein